MRVPIRLRGPERPDVARAAAGRRARSAPAPSRAASLRDGRSAGAVA